MMTDDENNNNKQVGSLGRYMFFGMWIGLLGLLTLFFYNWQQNEYNPNNNVNGILNPQNQAEVVLNANRQGQYIASGFINNLPVIFLVDTGANNVSIPSHIATKLNLPIGRKVQFDTANGLAMGYETKIQTIRIGNIQLQDIKASINPNVKYDEVLLGMSFLKHIELNQKDKTLTLRY
jgi:aspartyl protease family protein